MQTPRNYYSVANWTESCFIKYCSNKNLTMMYCFCWVTIIYIENYVIKVIVIGNGFGYLYLNP